MLAVEQGCALASPPLLGLLPATTLCCIWLFVEKMQHFSTCLCVGAPGDQGQAPLPPTAWTEGMWSQGTECCYSPPCNVNCVILQVKCFKSSHYFPPTADIMEHSWRCYNRVITNCILNLGRLFLLHTFPTNLLRIWHFLIVKIKLLLIFTFFWSVSFGAINSGF